MARSGPIILIDDDADDSQLLSIVFTELNIRNRIIYFAESEEAFVFLRDSQENPFLILSDINLPRQNGLELKRKIDNNPALRRKSIPFIFFSTSTDKKTIEMAYEVMTVQGYFQKPGTLEELKNVIKVIMDYWRLCREPNE